MAAGCGASCAKVILIIFNILFLLSGLALLAVGIWLVVDPSILLAKVGGLDDLVSSDRYLSYAAYVMIAAGAFIIVVSVFGCCGAIQESVCLLSVYIILLVLVMAIEIACGVLGIIFRAKIVSILEETATCNLYNRTGTTCDKSKPTPDTFVKAMRFVQHQFRCCGVHNHTDYKGKNDVVYKDHPDAEYLPWSCCTVAKDMSFEDLTGKTFDGEKKRDGADDTAFTDCRKVTKGTYYEDGCKTVILQWLEQYAPILIGLGIALAAFELFVIIFAVCLCRNTTEKDYD